MSLLFDFWRIGKFIVLSIHFPYDCNYFRTEKGLRESLHRLNDLWKEVRTNLAVEDSTYQLLKHMR